MDRAHRRLCARILGSAKQHFISWNHSSQTKAPFRRPRAHVSKLSLRIFAERTTNSGPRSESLPLGRVADQAPQPAPSTHHRHRGLK
jgi:hypothetical protein